MIADARIVVPESHPFVDAVRIANLEMVTGQAASVAGNEGKARVCSRRAVGFFLQGIASHLAVDIGPHAMANLRYVRNELTFPPELRDAAERLLGGARSILASEVYSSDPLADARLIINYFVDGASS